jgi:hypothetical protein
MELFDVVLPLAKRGENPQTNILVPPEEEIKLIDHFTLPDGSPLFAQDEFNPQLADMVTAMDFDKVFEVELRPDYQDQRVF